MWVCISFSLMINISQARPSWRNQAGDVGRKHSHEYSTFLHPSVSAQSIWASPSRQNKHRHPPRHFIHSHMAHTPRPRGFCSTDLSRYQTASLRMRGFHWSLFCVYRLSRVQRFAQEDIRISENDWNEASSSLLLLLLSAHWCAHLWLKRKRSDYGQSNGRCT